MVSEQTKRRLPPIEALNALPPAEFVAGLRPLFEAAEALAAGLYARRPFRSYQALLDEAGRVLAGLSEAEQVAAVNAHPRIGESASAVRSTSELSYREQGYDAEVGLDQARLAEVYRQLAELNAAYEARHGFRFVVFVNRRPKAAILEILRQRLPNPRQQELTSALHDLLAIARDRLASFGEEESR